MRPSFIRLVVTTVLLSWVLGAGSVVLYARQLPWTGEQARARGAPAVFRLLDGVAAPERPELMAALAHEFDTDLRILPRAEALRTGDPVPEPGGSVHLKKSLSKAVSIFAFQDGSEVLIFGPVNPSVPPGAFPIGILLMAIGLPLVASGVALLVERQLSRVERASHALAQGELSARVSGPTNELATRFNAMAERIERLVRSRDELIQAVSHELGSPLSRLRFRLELVASSTDLEAAHHIAGMTWELDVLDELVGELLGYVQADDGALVLKRFDVRPVLDDLAELARLEASPDDGVSLELKADDDTIMEADPRGLQRAIENLLRNAVRHAASRVRVELCSDTQNTLISVHDDGAGIPPELRERVTAPFVRLEPDRPRKTGGAGLGLAIVRRILERHGGQLSIQDSPLGGAAVITAWPRRSGR
ncbi:MAG: ATP-binding protein [Myxococcota bacterium]